MVQRLEQVQSQTQVLAPQLRQSLKILQVPALELRNVIREELQFNPTLEELPSEEISIERSESEKQEEPEEETSEKEIDFKENYLERLDRDSKEYYFEDHIHEDRQDQEERYAFTLNSIVHPTSLQEHLLQQAQLTDSSEQEIEIIRYILGSLDERGFLTLSEEEIAQQTQQSLITVQQALKTLRNLEPIGIACRNTQECLLQQLSMQNKESTLAARILREGYDLLLRNKIIEIARKFNVDKEEIQQAIQEITHLDPAPGRHFDTQTVQGIIPDVAVYKNGYGEWIIQLNNEFIPSLRISRTYKDLMGKKDLTSNDKNYLRLKMRSGRFLIQAIAQRQKTLERITQALLEVQNSFFEEGPKGLKPLTLQVLAERLEVHETTISRAIANKFMDTPFGVFEFKYFFTKGLASEEGHSIANTIVKQKISKFIEQENPTKPISDQKIVELLQHENICIARRTVAKYREALGIPATNLRKKFH